MPSDREIHLDAGIVIGLLNDADAHNPAVREALKKARGKGDRFAISSAAYAETLVLPAIAGAPALKHTKSAIERLCSKDPVPFTSKVAELAASLQAKHTGLRMLDAMIVASAQSAGAKYLLTTDKRLARLTGVRYVGD